MKQFLKRGMVLPLLLCLFLFFGALPASAQESRVFDEAGLLTEGQVGELEETIAVLRTDYPDLDFVFVTTDDTGGKDTQTYADDYYDAHRFGVGSDRSGILFLIDMDNRNLGISTTGKGIRYLTDSRIESLFDKAYPDVKNGDYFAAAEAFLSGAENYVKAGISGNQYNYDTDTGKVSRYKTLTPTEIVFSVLIAVAVAASCCGVILARYRKHGDKNSYPFREKSRMDLTTSEDIFLNQRVTTRRIPRNPPSSGGGFSGGRSSTHMSSSGSSHGGGTRGF